ncbi:hypothetical protein CR513_52995, partial [Mucuna pruriens]
MCKILGLLSYSNNFLDDFQVDMIDHMEPPASLSNFYFCGYIKRHRPAGSGVWFAHCHNGNLCPGRKTAALCNWCDTWKGDKLCGSSRQAWSCSEKYKITELLNVSINFLPLNLVPLTFFSLSTYWLSRHKIACQQMKLSPPICRPNKSVTTPHWCLIKVTAV